VIYFIIFTMGWILAIRGIDSNDGKPKKVSNFSQ